MQVRQIQTWKSISEYNLRPAVSVKSEPAGGWTRDDEIDCQQKLYGLLVVKRNAIAHEIDTAPYKVAYDKSLIEIARIRPSIPENLAKIELVTQAFVDRFGKTFLDTIDAFCAENYPFAPRDVLKFQPESSGQLLVLPEEFRQRLEKLTPTVQATYQMCVIEGKLPHNVARLRLLSESTVCSHLAEACRVGLPIDLESVHVTPEIMANIRRVVREPPINSDITVMKPIKEVLPAEYDYNWIKIVLSIMEYEHGIWRKGQSDAGKVVDVKIESFSPPPKNLPKSPPKRPLSQSHSRKTIGTVAISGQGSGPKKAKSSLFR